METEQVKAISNSNGNLTISISDRIDTSNATAIEQDINTILAENEYDNLILDFSELEYISSVGFRILMKLAKSNPGLKIENANSDVYEILEVTAIDTIIPITKKMREISVEGLEKIGSGFNGVVYRLDDETIVKVITNNANPDAIHNERNLAQKAFLMGIPSAIPFDVVKVGENYGIVYELLDSESYQSRIQNNLDQISKLGKRFGALGREINSIVVEDDTFGSATDRLLGQLESVKSKFNEEDYNSIKEVLEAIPESNNFIHGDFHPGNVLIQNDEPLLIDMATASKGHPIHDIITFAVPIVGSVYSHPDDEYVCI